jgi:hypothetical protein
VDVVDLLDIAIKHGVLVLMMRIETEGHIMIDVTEVTGEVIEEEIVITVAPDPQCQAENATTICMVAVIGVEEEVEEVVVEEEEVEEVHQ